MNCKRRHRLEDAIQRAPSDCACRPGCGGATSRTAALGLRKGAVRNSLTDQQTTSRESCEAGALCEGTLNGQT
jgi:hypothetical protein